MKDLGIEISIEQMREMKKEDYLLVDVRNESSYQYGFIPGAVNITQQELEQGQGADRLPKDKIIIVYCMKGIFSQGIAEELTEEGYQAHSLLGGYGKWLTSHSTQEPRYEEIEKSIRKKFHKTLFSRFAKAINEYQLVQEGDKIAICISGGKDSMLMAKLFQELKRHNKFAFDLEFLVMDPGYNETNRILIENNAKLLDVPIRIFETNIFDAVFEIEKSPCYICARMRRGHLYNKAKELGCNKIALGHHYDDVIETILMGMMYGAQIQTMMPKLHSTNFEGMELIRPMYLIREADIKHWRDYNDLHFIQCACKFTETCSTCNSDGSVSSKRMEIKNLIQQLKEINPYIESNIFKSVENVNLNTVIAYKEGGKTHHFLDEYDKE